MTWRKAMNRRRAARLAQELPAVARPSEGPAATPGTSSLNSAGVSSQVAPAVFCGGANKKGRKTHVISKEELAPLVAQGLNDVKIGKLYGHSASWTQHLRSIYGIRPACGPGGFAIGAPRPRKPAPPPKIVAPPEPPPAPKPTREQAHEARYAAFFAEHGAYPSFTAHDITMIELGKRSVALGKPRARSVTAAFFGDPAPDRPRA